VIAFGAFEQPLFETYWPAETRSSIIRVWQREQRGSSIAVNKCWDEVTMLPAQSGTITDSLSPMVADGRAAMEPPSSCTAGQYCSLSKINELAATPEEPLSADYICSLSNPDGR
jgi:hypothetical protein